MIDLRKSPFYFRMDEEGYHALSSWSYSIIAKYARNGFKAIETLHDKIEPTQEMKFGSLFDSMMTRGLKHTLENYIVFEGELPPASIKAVLDNILTESSVSSWEDVDNATKISVMDSLEYQKRWKNETRIDSLNKYIDYYDFIYNAYGKEVISAEDWDDAMEMRNNMMSNSYTASIFGDEGLNGDVEYMYQPQFMIKTDVCGRSVNLKCMFDLIVINHKKRTIRPVDLKTSHMPAYEFPEHWLKMRYDIQAGLYTYILQNVVDEMFMFENNAYRVLPFLFVDISRTDKTPVVFEYDPRENENTQVRYCKLKDWKTLLEEIITYEDNRSKVPSYIVENRPNDIIELLKKYEQ